MTSNVLLRYQKDSPRQHKRSFPSLSEHLDDLERHSVRFHDLRSDDESVGFDISTLRKYVGSKLVKDEELSLIRRRQSCHISTPSYLKSSSDHNRATPRQRVQRVQARKLAGATPLFALPNATDQQPCSTQTHTPYFSPPALSTLGYTHHTRTTHDAKNVVFKDRAAPIHGLHDAVNTERRLEEMHSQPAARADKPQRPN